MSVPTATRTAPAPAGAAAGRLAVGSPLARRLGLTCWALALAFLGFDAVIHIAGIEAVRESEANLGFAPGSFGPLGVLELACLVLYAVPRTRVLGAVLLTAYLGGAMSAQVRIDAPLFSTLLFPVYTGIVVWAGVWLRDARVRALLPLR